MAARSGDPWQQEFNEARVLADDAFVLLQERRSQLANAADASVARLSAASRRKLNSLNSKVSALEASLAQGDVSAKEQDRRRDCVARLRTHAAQLAELLAKKDGGSRRCVRLWPAARARSSGSLRRSACGDPGCPRGFVRPRAPQRRRRRGRRRLRGARS